MTSVVRQPYLRVTIDGQDISNVLSADCAFSFEQRTATATIVVPERPVQAEPWSTVIITMGASRAGAQLRFRGLLTDVGYALWPRAVTLRCQGPLGRAKLSRNSVEGGTSFANGGLGTTDEAQIEAVLAACGVTDMDIQGTGIPIGSIALDQVVWHEGETGLSYIQELDAVCLGYRTYDAPGGRVVRRQITARPAGSAALTFTEGVDILSARQSATPLGIRNRIIVIGYDNGAGPVVAVRQQASNQLPPGVEYVTEEVRNNLVERASDESPGNGLSAAAVAEWKLLTQNLLRVSIPFETPRDDLIVPGMTIRVEAPDRLGTSANFWVQGVNVGIDESGAFSQRITAIGGPGSTQPIEAPPLVDFSMQVEIEEVFIAGAVAPLYVVYAEDASVGQTGPIATRAWSLPGGTPASGDGTQFVSALTSVSGASLTLTVTDEAGSSSSVSKAVDAVPQGDYLQRRMFTAAEVVAEAYDGTDWRTQPPDNAAPVNVVTNGPLWIAGDRVYRSETMLSEPMVGIPPFVDSSVDPPVVTANPTDVWTELDANAQLAMAGADDGRVAISQDAGTTWEVKAGPSSDPVVRCVISRNDPNRLYVMTATEFYTSFDGGITWIFVQGAEAGETFRDLNVSHTRLAIAMAGGRLLMDAESGQAMTLPVLDPPITDMVAVTAHIREDRFFAIDATGRTFATTAHGGVAMEQRVSVPAGEAQPRGLWRDGDIPGLLYMALGTGGVWKSIDGFNSAPGYYQMRAPGADNSPATAIHRRVGTDGRLVPATPPTAGNVYLVMATGIARRSSRNQWVRIGADALTGSLQQLASPRGQPDRLWVLSSGTGAGVFTSVDGGQSWTRATLPVSAVDVRWIFCADGELDTVYLCVDTDAATSGLWKSLDGGATWTQIVGPFPDSFSEGAIQGQRFGTRIWFNIPQVVGSNIYQVHYTDDEGATLERLSFTSIQLGWMSRSARNAPGTSYIFNPSLFTAGLFRQAIGGGLVNITPANPGIEGHPLWAEGGGQNTVLMYYGTGNEGDQQMLFRSATQGDDWQVVLGPMPEFVSDADLGTRLALHPQVETDWWLAGGQSGGNHVFHSTDDGLTWQAEVCNVGLGEVRDITVTG